MGSDPSKITSQMNRETNYCQPSPPRRPATPPTTQKFETVLTDQDVEAGNTIILKCRVKTEGDPRKTRSVWKKDNERLRFGEGKHTATKSDDTYTLTIQNAEHSDEGIYSLTLEFGENFKESASCSAWVRVVLKKPWREVKWDTINQTMIKDKLQNFNIFNGVVEELRFLVCGQIGAGKSSTINTMRSIFEGRQCVNAIAGVAAKSQSIYYEKEEIQDATGKSLPFAFFDMMGMESTNGVLNEDIISCIKGHVKEGYEFQESVLLGEESPYYNAHPSLNDKIHCLVYVMSAPTLAIQADEFINKMASVRKEATRLRMPQVVFLTKVDEECPLAKKNLQNVYRSRKIKEKMEKCSVTLGVPMNCIFPIENYHEQTHMNDDINCLMLDALSQIAHFANDYVKKCSRIAV